MTVLIQQISPADVPMELLLLADPSEQKIRSYVQGSKCFVALKNGNVVGAGVVKAGGKDTHELMSIAVHPDHQKSGIGTILLKWIIEFYKNDGARELEVGTGTFGYQLAFYQRLGFRVTGIDHNFFVRNYEEPLYEEGIRLMDMLRLSIKFNGDTLMSTS